MCRVFTTQPIINQNYYKFMKKNSILGIVLGTMICFGTSSVNAETYSPDSVYHKGDEVSITLNGKEVKVVYLNDAPSSSFNPSTPLDVNNGWLWSVSKNYTGEWVPYHYVLFEDEATTVTYSGNTYKLIQEMWPTSSSPSVASSEGWGWQCLDCATSSSETCQSPYATDYFPISLAQLNNGNDNTTPPNASGNAGTIQGQGGKFININQERSCNTPLALYNNDIYFRDGCDPHSGIGYYGVCDNTNVPAPAKRLFADTDTDGPVLYGWNGGALGIRQRNNLDVVNGPHIEKIALQWTPSEILLGTETLPMPLKSYTTVSVNNLTGSTRGFYVTGTEKTKAFSVYDNTNKTTSFVVYGNGVVNAKKIYAEEIEVLPSVNGNKWPDYVFEDNYKLRTIQELESYVNENKHLPEIPSADAMQESSVNLAEMNMALLKKVEELTLYIIDLQGQINTVNKEVEGLK